jgi:transglutaminase-like putative cysteine protease
LPKFQESHLSTRWFLSPLLALLLVGPPAASVAQESEPFRRWYTYDYHIRSNELADVTQRVETEVIAPSMVQSLGQHRLTINAHFFDLEIVEAATIKADGRRIEVQRDKIVELSGAESSTNILFQADVKTRVLPFPELAAGDRTVVVTRVTQKRPTMAGGLSRSLAFPPVMRIEEAKITVDAPRDLKLHVSERALQHTREQQGDRTIVRWTIPRQSYAADEAGSVAAIDWAPMLVFSTYENWDGIGRRVFQLADPKSQRSEEIDKLAEDITRGITDRRQQAAAIYDWVAKNIRYFLVILGQGGFEPHDTASILANRYGDCKDHTTLMRALLRAKGIESEFVLINQQRVYKTYEVPVLGFDHMIIYLPEFDLYADPTVAVGSFDALPSSLADKPVVRVSAKATTLGRTPALKAEQYAVQFTSEATVQADGTIVGRNTLVAKGTAAIDARGIMRQFEQRGASEAVKLMLTRQRWAGSSTFETRSPYDRSDPYEVKSSFNLTSMTSRLNTTAVVVPTGLRLFNRPLGGYALAVRENRLRDFPCDALSWSEQLTVNWPEGKKALLVPKGVKISKPFGEYESSYKQNGRSLQVSRKLVWRVPGKVCTRQIANDLRDVAVAAARDFSARFRIVDVNFNGPFNDDQGSEIPD